MDDTNPFDDSLKKSRDETEFAFLKRARVSSVESQSEGQHTVSVQRNGIVVSTDAPILNPVHGDYYIPPSGAPVMTVPSSRNNHNVIATYTPPVPTPSLQPGERVVSHPLSTASVKFNADGSLDIQGDAKIRINGGGVGVITDIDTTTDSDGHVTSIDLVRNDNITLPQ